MRKILSYKKIVIMGGLIAIDILFFGFTNPTNVASWLLIVGFGLVVATLYVGLRLALSIGGVYNPWFQRQRRPGAYLTGVLAAMLALQSIGQLSLRDSVVLFVLSAVLAVYYGYSRKNAA